MRRFCHPLFRRPRGKRGGREESEKKAEWPSRPNSVLLSRPGLCFGLLCFDRVLPVGPSETKKEKKRALRGHQFVARGQTGRGSAAKRWSHGRAFLYICSSSEWQLAELRTIDSQEVSTEVDLFMRPRLLEILCRESIWSGDLVLRLDLREWLCCAQINEVSSGGVFSAARSPTTGLMDGARTTNVPPGEIRRVFEAYIRFMEYILTFSSNDC